MISRIRLKAAIIGKILTRPQITLASGHILSPESYRVGILMRLFFLNVSFAAMRH